MHTPQQIDFHRLSGLKVAEFLQGQCTADITKIDDGVFQLTGICNAKGRLVASPTIIYCDHTYYLAVENNMADTLFAYWKPFLMLSRVKVELVEDITQINKLEPMIQSISKQSTFSYCMEHGLVLITPETSKLWMPMALSYENFNALSFQKGCYVGQEILARVHYKGKVTKKVMIADFSEAVNCQPGMTLTDMDNKTIGVIASAPIDAETQKALVVCSTQMSALTTQTMLNDQSIDITLKDINYAAIP
jgi:hypothetical protein